MADTIGILTLLIGLELVLGVDDVLVIAIFVGRLPGPQRQKARVVGLSMAMAARILMPAVVLTLVTLTRPIIAGLSVRDRLNGKVVGELYAGDIEHRGAGFYYDKAYKLGIKLA